MRTVLITGGYGFIGTELVKLWMQRRPKDRIVVLDSMTYAAQPQNLLKHLELGHNNEVILVKGDICHKMLVTEVMRDYKVNDVVNCAAESHVCRGLETPLKFLNTNTLGTFTLLEAMRSSPHAKGGRFLQVSTDEVWGELSLNNRDKKFTDKSLLHPRQPYAASKAAAEMYVTAYHHAYGIDTVITNCSNNYGPTQDAEKLIPKTVRAMIQGKPVEVYQDGAQVRDWIHVKNHCEGLVAAFEQGKPGERYAFGGNWELSVNAMVEIIGETLNLDYEVRFVGNRQHDDRRYAVRPTTRLKWKPLTKPKRWEALRKTIKVIARQELE